MPFFRIYFYRYCSRVLPICFFLFLCVWQKVYERCLLTTILLKVNLYCLGGIEFHLIKRPCVCAYCLQNKIDEMQYAFDLLPSHMHVYPTGGHTCCAAYMDSLADVVRTQFAYIVCISDAWALLPFYNATLCFAVYSMSLIWTNLLAIFKQNPIQLFNKT